MNSQNSKSSLLMLATALLFATSLSPALLGARKRASVFVDSFATEEYQQRRAAADAPAYETFSFFKGRYFGGNVRDSSLKVVPFEDVVQTLAKEMRQQRYLPAPQVGECDLFIVVHWGVSEIDDFAEMMEEMNQDEDFEFGDDAFGGDEEIDTVSSAQDDRFYTETYDRRVRKGAMDNRDLGFNRALNQRGLMPQDEYELQISMEDERYFMILMAYDFKHLIEKKELKFLWSTRFSVSSIGTNFEDAYLALARAAGPFYGQHLEAGERSRTHFGEGDVNIGEIQILDDEEKPAEE